jgi:hypothetical protein
MAVVLIVDTHFMQKPYPTGQLQTSMEKLLAASL